MSWGALAAEWRAVTLEEAAAAGGAPVHCQSCGMLVVVQHSCNIVVEVLWMQRAAAGARACAERRSAAAACAHAACARPARGERRGAREARGARAPPRRGPTEAAEWRLRGAAEWRLRTGGGFEPPAGAPKGGVLGRLACGGVQMASRRAQQARLLGEGLRPRHNPQKDARAPPPLPILVSAYVSPLPRMRVFEHGRGRMSSGAVVRVRGGVGHRGGGGEAPAGGGGWQRVVGGGWRLASGEGSGAAGVGAGAVEWAGAREWAQARLEGAEASARESAAAEARERLQVRVDDGAGVLDLGRAHAVAREVVSLVAAREVAPSSGRGELDDFDAFLADELETEELMAEEARREEEAAMADEVAMDPHEAGVPAVAGGVCAVAQPAAEDAQAQPKRARPLEEVAADFSAAEAEALVAVVYKAAGMKRGFGLNTLQNAAAVVRYLEVAESATVHRDHDTLREVANFWENVVVDFRVGGVCDMGAGRAARFSNSDLRSFREERNTVLHMFWALHRRLVVGGAEVEAVGRAVVLFPPLVPSPAKRTTCDCSVCGGRARRPLCACGLEGEPASPPPPSRRLQPIDRRLFAQAPRSPRPVLPPSPAPPPSRVLPALSAAAATLAREWEAGVRGGWRGGAVGGEEVESVLGGGDGSPSGGATGRASGGVAEGAGAEAGRSADRGGVQPLTPSRFTRMLARLETLPAAPPAVAGPAARADAVSRRLHLARDALPTGKEVEQSLAKAVCGLQAEGLAGELGGMVVEAVALVAVAPAVSEPEGRAPEVRGVEALLKAALGSSGAGAERHDGAVAPLRKVAREGPVVVVPAPKVARVGGGGGSGDAVVQSSLVSMAVAATLLVEATPEVGAPEAEGEGAAAREAVSEVGVASVETAQPKKAVRAGPVVVVPTPKMARADGGGGGGEALAQCGRCGTLGRAGWVCTCLDDDPPTPPKPSGAQVCPPAVMPQPRAESEGAVVPRAPLVQCDECGTLGRAAEQCEYCRECPPSPKPHGPPGGAQAGDSEVLPEARAGAALEPVVDGFNRIRLLTLNVSGMALKGPKVSNRRWDELSAVLQLWRRPELVALQECGGGVFELAELARRMQGLGYDAAYREGEHAESGWDGHRRGGVLLAWRQCAFRRDPTEALYGGGGPHGVALVSSAVVEEMREQDHVTQAVYAGLRAVVGKRAIAVRLIRKTGPCANAARWFSNVYVPASASDQLRCAFIRCVADELRRFVVDGLPYTCAGDWQASPYPSYRRSGRANKSHDNELRDLFYDAGDGERVGVEVPWALSLRGSIGGAVGEYSFHDARGFHATIDHVFASVDEAGRWEAVAYAFTFLGARGFDHDESARFDHRVGLFALFEGERQLAGLSRAPAKRLSKAVVESGEFARAVGAIREPCGAGAGGNLAELESMMASVAAKFQLEFDPRDLKWRRHLAPDGLPAKLAFLKGLHEVVLRSYEMEAEGREEECRLAFFEDPHGSFFRVGFLRNRRQRTLRRVAAGGMHLHGKAMWKLIRADVEHELRRRVVAVEASVSAQRAEEREAARAGEEEPCGSEEMARKLLEHQRKKRQAKRGGAFKVSALAGPDGVVAREPSEVHRIAYEHGVRQNRVSACDEAATEAWVHAFCPVGAPLVMPDGSDFSLERALPLEVFVRELRLVPTGKAPGLHPFLTDYLQALPDDHPVMAMYHKLLLKCMAACEYPAHYLQIIATLIPKTYGALTSIDALRDIWLLNHGAKLAERLILKAALIPVGERVLPCHAGGCAGRGCAEQAFALHAAIEEAHAAFTPLYVLWVDLIKCFMSFSRRAGRVALMHLGVPTFVVDALQALCEDAKGQCVSGRFETAFGSSDEFALLRGFLQGAHASPEQCKVMMNTLAEALELKTVGYVFFAPDGAGADVVQLVFVDDAAGLTQSVGMMQRVALFWSLWCAVTDSQANIHALKKTVLSGVEFRRNKLGEMVPVTTDAEVYMVGLCAGDAPRRVPVMCIRVCYKYVGFWTCLSRNHLRTAVPEIRKKFKAACASAVDGGPSLRLARSDAAAGVLGNACYYGAIYGGTVAQVEEWWGPAARQVASSGKLGRQKRARSAPRLLLHAPERPMDVRERANDDMAQAVVNAAGPAAAITGFGLPHPYPPMMASTVATFMACLASPYDTPGARAAQCGLARVAWECGCRVNPCRFDFRAWMGLLDQTVTLERGLWMVLSLHGGRLMLDEHFPPRSALHSSRWPGYPDGWRPLWRGQLRVTIGAIKVQRLLARAGVVELANLCTACGSEYMTVAQLVGIYPRVLYARATAVRAGLSRRR